MRKVYTLQLTEEEHRAVKFASSRYEWAKALNNIDGSELSCGVVFYDGHESDWWAVKEAVGQDDAPYPLADDDLAIKIDNFLSQFE